MSLDSKREGATYSEKGSGDEGKKIKSVPGR